MNKHNKRTTGKNHRLAGAAMALLLFALAGVAGASEEPEAIAIEPANAFPADTVFYLELREPVSVIDRFSEMAFWPHVVTLMTETVGLLGSGEHSAAFLSNALGSWGEESELRQYAQLLAGRRCVAGLVPVAGSDRVVPLILFERSESTGSLLSLASIVSSFAEGVTLKIEKGLPSEPFSILDSDGKTLLLGRVSDRWLMVSTPSGAASVDTAAHGLSPKGPPLEAPLSALDGFKKVMSQLPQSADGRAYLSSARAEELVDRCDALSPFGKRLAKACLSWTGAVGVAREIGPDTISTTVTGEIAAEKINAALPGLLDALRPIEQPLSQWLPRNALCAYEVGAPPAALFDTVCFFVKSLSPWLHKQIEALCADFESATGLDPAADLFPYLGSSMAAAVLASEGAEAAWPFPRSVALVRVNDAEKVTAFVSSFMQWDATMWAPFSGGLIGGRAVTSHHDGVELFGIELDCVIGMPLPSPTVALVDGFLIASSVRSGVSETIDALRGKKAALSAEIITGDRPIPPNTVELVHLNCPAWGPEWARCWKAAAGPCCSLMLDGEFLGSAGLNEEKLDRLGEALSNVLGSLERATGTTTVGDDGVFEFFIEVRVR